MGKELERLVDRFLPLNGSTLYAVQNDAQFTAQYLVYLLIDAQETIRRLEALPSLFERLRRSLCTFERVLDLGQTRLDFGTTGQQNEREGKNEELHLSAFGRGTRWRAALRIALTAARTGVAAGKLFEAIRVARTVATTPPTCLMRFTFMDLFYPFVDFPSISGACFTVRTPRRAR